MKINDDQLLSLFFFTALILFLTPIAKAQIVQQEKVYIHTNKPSYNLGDTLWFKAYVTQGSRNKLTALSGSIRLPVVEGTANGDLVFGDDCQAGIYRIRAYN